MSKILLIEPNTVLAKAYTEALEQKGYDVVHAVGAQEAIDAADAASPDIVILELQLSAHNGIEFLHEFRSYPEWQNVPVIVNTYMTPAALDTAKEALVQQFGVKRCLYKPQTSLGQLISAVEQQADS